MTDAALKGTRLLLLPSFYRAHFSQRQSVALQFSSSLRVIWEDLDFTLHMKPTGASEQ